MADTTTDWTGGNPFLGQNNPYLQANIDAASADLVRNFNTSAVPAFNASMLRSGSFGNSAIDEMTRNAQSDLQKNLGNLSNTARFNDYNQQQGMYQWQKGREDQNRQWDLGFDKSVYDATFNQGQQTLQSGIGLLGTLAGYNASDINNSTTQQNTPLDYWNIFSQGANSIGQGFGSGQTVQGTTSNPLVSGLGGAQIGKAAWDAWRTPSTSSGTQAPASGNYDSTGWNNWATYGSGGD